MTKQEMFENEIDNCHTVESGGNGQFCFVDSGITQEYSGESSS